MFNLSLIFKENLKDLKECRHNHLHYKSYKNNPYGFLPLTHTPSMAGAILMFQEHIIDCYKGLIMRCSANLLDDNYLNTSSFDSPICKWSYFMNAQLYGVIPEVMGLLDFSQRLRIFNKKNKMFYLPLIKHLNKTSLLAQIDDKQQFKLINILTTQSKRNGRKITLVTSYLDITNDNIRQKILTDLKIELTELETINSNYNTLFDKLMRFKYG